MFCSECRYGSDAVYGKPSRIVHEPGRTSTMIEHTTIPHVTSRIKLGFHIRGKRKRLAVAACGCGMRYANDLIPYTFTHAVALSFLV